MKLLSTFLLYSLLGTSASALKIVVPPQIISRTTHYPTWRTPVPGWDAEQLDTVIASSFVGALIGVILAFRYLLTKRALTESIDETYHKNSHIFSTAIAYYIISTLLAILGFWILDLGKLWSTVGAVHNLLEVSILLIMTFSEHPNMFKYLYILLFVYLAFTEWFCLILPWPYDGIFFKFQGLATDIALIFGFYRLYLVNKHINDEYTQGLDEMEGVEFGHNEYTSLLSTPAKVKSYKSYLFSNNLTHDQFPSTSEIASLVDPNQASNNIKLLITASIIHVFGNTIATVSDLFLPFLVFQFSYGIVFFLYGYYISQQSKTSQLQWYKSSMVSEALVAFVSIVLSAIIVGIGVCVTLQRFQDYAGENEF